ncbi:XdhC family protein [Mucilaginibacter sp. BT774]|uniref:XdhC family protein n=1 Tax=Mucilaginibacter sp. BT774 TaxID=3062276 RepID=UPI002675BB62|nr:XdhC family protein [Mucilaginibacter sp. BT774]MDO3627834.1 XdhC family protein [Mucilaginibacter sp. BT774]
MKEIKAIIKAYDEADKASLGLALATVVRVEGSSYRRTGARMLILDNGIWVGGISGGCLEGDALKRAQLAIRKSTPTLITYDTTDDDPYQIGVGLGCNGVIDVLLTPLNVEDKNNPVEVLKRCVEASRETHILITITKLSGDWRGVGEGEVIKYVNAQSLNILKDSLAIQELNKAVAEQVSVGHSAPYYLELEDGRKLGCFIEILPPEVSMILMGHQYDVYPLSRLIKEMGWRLTIVAELQKINPHIIMIADEVVAPANFEDIFIDNYTAIIIMAHDYKTDKNNLPKALATVAPYIGMLGPRVRSEKIWRELAEEGRISSTENMDRIHAPVGLDIGAVTPEEIALSLIAEVKAALSGRDGTFLRLRTTVIHNR